VIGVDPTTMTSRKRHTERPVEVRAAEKICEIYFNIAATTVGEDRVREMFQEQLQQWLDKSPQLPLTDWRQMAQALAGALQALSTSHAQLLSLAGSSLAPEEVVVLARNTANRGTETLRRYLAAESIARQIGEQSTSALSRTNRPIPETTDNV